MKIYTNQEFATLISDCKNDVDIDAIAQYVLRNAVQIIKLYGESYYNVLAFMIEEKIRLLFPVTI